MSSNETGSYHHERRYVIFNTSETGSIDFSQVLETSVDTLRLNSGSTQTFVKYEGGKSGSMPSSVSALSTKGNELTWFQMRDILTGSAWSFPTPGEDSTTEWDETI